MTSGFTINSNKSKVIIDGTYNNTKFTYMNYLSLYLLLYMKMKGNIL